MLGSGLVVPPAQAHAAKAPGDGTVSVSVVRDVNSDGSYDAALEVGQAGIPVTLTDDAGNTLSLTTDASGKVTFDPATSGLTGSKYRVEATIPATMSYLKPAPANGPAPTLSSMVAFVDVTGGVAANVVMGVTDPADYVQANPDLVTPTSIYAGLTNTDPAQRAMFRWPYAQVGDLASARPNVVANYGQIGTTYGLAWKRTSKLLFAGALAKRHAFYGPGGSGGIYVLDAAGNASLFAQLTDAGTTAHNTADPFHDETFFTAPGKEALGDLEISQDGNTLYAVNLATKSLVTFDVTNAALGQAPASPTGATPIPNPGCASADDWRPWGLGYNDGKIYVGGVCSAQSTGARADLKAYVLDATTMAPVFSHSLDFERASDYTGGPNNTTGEFYWNPWTDTWNPAGWHQSVGPENLNRPTPMLSDIEFDRDGSMMLGFRDRFGDQLGAGGGDLTPGTTNVYRVIGSGGALERACKNADGTWSWQGENGCPNNVPGGPNAPYKGNAVEFYAGSWAQLSDASHNETAQGGLVFAPRFTDVVSTVLDPNGEIGTGGVGHFDNKTGAMESEKTTRAYTLQRKTKASKGRAYTLRREGDFTNGGTFGKANGLGDLELLADPAPIQLGNRVWLDLDGDGIQDPTEQPLAGVTVTLKDAAGNVVGTTTTNALGEYYFDNVAPNTAYQICFDPATATNLPAGITAASLKPTVQDAGTDDAINSDIGADRCLTTTTGAPGASDHTLDAGFVPTVSIGDRVWLDLNKNGIQDPGEPNIPGVTVTLKDAAGNVVATTTTDANGNYRFDGLKPLTQYTVSFDVSTADTSGLPGTPAPSDLAPTIKNAGNDPAIDSNIGPDGSVTVTTPQGGEDLTIDAGFTEKPVAIGDFVWFDTNRNGIQDPGEPGIPGVKVTLKDAAGNVVATTTTDANGMYRFDGLPPGTPYTLTFDPSGADTSGLPGTPDPRTLQPTVLNAGGDPAKDSSLAPDGTMPATSPPDGEDMTFDGGYVIGLVSIGDFVWFDTNKNGIQDPGEPGIPGVKVTLKDAAGNVVATTTTDANGMYRFDNLMPLTDYTLEFDPSGADTSGLPGTPDPRSLKPTIKNAGTDKAKDSEIGPDGTAPAKSPVTGEDMTFDAGYIIGPVSIGDRVWLDLNKNGIQDAGEPGIPGVKVTLKDATGNVVATTTTDADGKYLFDNLPPLTDYTLEFDPSGADTSGLPGKPSPKSLQPTKKTVSPDKAKDSDISPDGTAAATSPVTGSDLTYDAGYIVAPVSIGDRVWLDLNKNGIQDPGEPGIPGVKVTLKDPATGKVVATTTTDANGNYRFDGLTPGKQYKLCFDPSMAKTSGLPGSPSASMLVPTKANAGGDNAKDSDIGGTGCMMITTPLTGSKLDFDAGFVVSRADLAIKLKPGPSGRKLAKLLGMPNKPGRLGACPCGITSFKVKVTNKGKVTARGIKVSVPIPAGTKLLPGMGWKLSGGVATKTIAGPLKPGESKTLLLPLKIKCGFTGSTLRATGTIMSWLDPGGVRQRGDVNRGNDSSTGIIDMRCPGEKRYLLREH